MLGRFYHTVDQKNRLIIPSKIKDELGLKVYISCRPEGCINIFSEAEWEKYYAKLTSLPHQKGSDILRWINGMSADVIVDSQGRIQLDSNFVKFAKITKDIVTVGCGNYAEVWSKEVWDEKNYELPPENLADTLAELGL